jgi:hypothetical protein
MGAPLRDRKLGIVIIAYLACVALLVFGAGAAVKGSYGLAAGLFILSLLAIAVAISQGMRRGNVSLHDLGAAVAQALRQRKQS